MNDYKHLRDSNSLKIARMKFNQFGVSGSRMDRSGKS